MDRNKLLVEPRYLGVPSGAFKTISKAQVRLAQTVHLSWIQTDQNEIPHEPRHLGLPLGASKMISKPLVRSVQSVHRSCVKISTICKRTKTSF
jgi:hypothetical protein